MDERLIRAADHWSNTAPPDKRRDWWLHPVIVRHVNRLICGEEIDGQSAGLQQLLKASAPPDGFRRGVSIGSGVAAKEIALLAAGIVQTFDLFEISEDRLRASKRLARRNDVFERIRFHHADALELDLPESFDLSYWNSSLHHMFDARAAVAWSHRSLTAGGCFAMEEYVGPSRFQWTDQDLQVAAKVRHILPDRLIRDPDDPSQSRDPELQRPDLEEFIAVDPSEAADSANILSAVKEIFPGARIIPIGGIVYSLALNDVIANFDETEDAMLMRSLLLLDETLANSGHTHLAAALAVKEQAA